MDKRKKRTIGLLLLSILVLLATVGLTLAWFFNQRSLKTAASLISPYTLRIGAGSNESIEQLDMGNIDVSTAPGHKDYVICVYGNPSVPYVMQLAHTTNIGFQYEVFYAGSPQDKKPLLAGDFAEYTDMKDKVHYFPIVSGNTVRKVEDADTILMDSKNYINQDGDTKIADESLKQKETSGDDVIKGSYDQTDSVQKNASALYMQSDTVYPTEQEDDYGEFVHYYVVRISWDANIKNDKETDIVYLTVSAK